MLRIGTRTILLASACCLLLAGCGPAKHANTAAGTKPPAPAAANPGPTGGAGAGGGGLTACGLISEQDASTAIGKAAGPGKSGGGPALSECIYGDGSLIVSMKTDSKAFYDKSHSSATAKGATDVPGVGDGAFKAGTAQFCTLEFLKGTTLVSILLNGAGAQDAAVTIAKVAAAKM